MATVGLQREGRRKLAHKAVIWGVYVAPSFRGRGIGRRLLEHALAHAKSMPDLLHARTRHNGADSTLESAS